MELNVYTPGFEYLGCIDTFTSFRFRRQCFDAGEIELHCQANENNLYLAQEDYFILRDGYDEIGVIEGRKIGDGDDGAMIAATGRLGNCILERAIIDKTYNINGKIEEAMRKLISEQLPKVYANIELGALNGFTETVSAQISYKSLLAALIALSKCSNIFFRLRPDVAGKKLIFETYKGKDRTISQAENPRVVFSDLDETLSSPTYEKNKKNYKNYAIVAGEGEGDARTVITVNRIKAGEDRRELFVDAKDLQKGDLTQDEYIAQLTQRGNEKLDEAVIVENFETSIETSGNYKYREDWDVGDEITCHKSEWNIIADTRITEAEEVYEQDTGENGTVTPVFGSPLPEKFNIGG